MTDGRPEPAPASPPPLAFRSVGFDYGSGVVLDSIDLAVERGEVVALVGSSGAGKSTLLSLANGTLRPTSGAVELAGADLDPLRGRVRRAALASVGTVPQQAFLPGSLRVVHNVNSGRLGSWSTWRSLRSLLSPLQVAEARDALDQLGIAELIDARTDSLSGGQQQRVAIARALVSGPEIVLADEPVSAVDPAWSDEVMNLLVERSRSDGTAVLVSLHDADLALRSCDRIVALRSGRIELDRSVASLQRSDLDAIYELSADPGE